ncbi:exported hypothetical protein [Candidatus Contendobacter odensis Run_B_J11]|uniref:SH3b domain-containing protein n=2 Tax=Candidatus Contendibacter odensensis TaxID=1400860 RepID=A0A7U7J385_9GAMM|nr:exported hypothetical protein [Candidatus Contendobacter odensis Run_B_J11]
MKKTLVGVAVVALSGCSTIRSLDERISAHLQGSFRPAARTNVRVVEDVRVFRPVPLREGPGNGYKIIRMLQPGETWVPLGAIGPWQAVRIGPQSGFIFSRSVAKAGIKTDANRLDPVKF